MKDQQAILRDALRYRFLRSAASRDHHHHKLRALDVQVVDWNRNFDPNALQNFWAACSVHNREMDRAVDRAMKRNSR